MVETRRVREAVTDRIKQLLRQRKLTYRQLAQRIGMSHSGLKKLLNAEDLPLSRLGAICAALDLSLAEFFREVDGERRRLLHLTPAQEQCLGEDPTALQVFSRLAHQGWTVAQILARDRLSRGAVYAALRRLEATGLLRWLPEDHIQLCCPPFPLLAGSPAFARRLKARLLELLVHRALRDGDPAELRVRYYRASAATLERLQRVIDQALEEADASAATESRLLAAGELRDLCVGVLLTPGSLWACQGDVE
jgi:DNA-binding Xre family transcriptional regulator/DNA-binding PadR family transcriptional regulator